MDNGSEKTDDGSTTTWGRVASALAGVLTVLMLTPFNPVMPIAGVDGSWTYAMNVATAEHLRFGKDIVFTFGPWASVYTRAYYPATDGLMMGGSLLIAIAFFMGLLALVAPRRRPLLLLAPLVLALVWSPWWNGWRDAVLLLVPLLLPFVVMRGGQRGRPFVATVCIVAAASAILPLVKGNISLMVAVATAIALVLSWRSSPRIAVMIVVVQLLTLVAAWWIAGQRLVDLPGYFLAQAPIISGYTDAMSVGGRWFGLVVFTVLGAVLLGIAALCGRRQHWYIPVLVAVYLFITFKSGFVRQDEHHALVSAAALAWVGLVLLLGPGSGDGRGIVAFSGGLLGWGLITSACVSLAPDASIARLAEAVYNPVQGAWWRVAQPDVLPAKFRKEVSLIGARPPFAGYTGTAKLFRVHARPGHCQCGTPGPQSAGKGLLQHLSDRQPLSRHRGWRQLAFIAGKLFAPQAGRRLCGAGAYRPAPACTGARRAGESGCRIGTGNWCGRLGSPGLGHHGHSAHPCRQSVFNTVQGAQALAESALRRQHHR